VFAGFSKTCHPQEVYGTFQIRISKKGFYNGVAGENLIGWVKSNSEDGEMMNSSNLY